MLIIVYMYSNKKKSLTKSKSLYDHFLDGVIDIMNKLVGEKKVKSIENKIVEKFFVSKIKAKKPFKLFLALKILIPIIIFIIMFTISYTNLNLHKDSILKDYNFSTTQIQKKSLMGLSEREYKELQEVEKNIVLDIFSEIENEEYEKLDDADKRQYVISILQRKYDLSDEENYIYSNRIVNKKAFIEGMRLNWLFILSITIASFWLFDLLLIGLGKWGKSDIDDELEQLELTTVLIGATPYISAFDILVGLESTAKFFKPYLEEAKNEYTISSDNALQTLRKTPYSDFQIITKTLQQAKNSNLEKAIDNLKKHLERKRKKKEIEEEDSLNKKDMLVHLFIIVSMGFLLMMWFYPLSTIFANLN